MSAIVKVNIDDEQHLNRVADYSLMIAKKLNLFHDDLEALYQASLIHELNCIDAFEHLSNIELISDVIKYKDEWFDGSGKLGLEGGITPLLSRIFSIAHFYDELIQKVSNIEASKVLHQQAFSRFDPMLIPIAIKALEERK